MYSGKKYTIKFLPLVLCALALVVAACGGSNSTTSNNTGSNQAAAPASKQVFRYSMLDSDISTFDPALSQDTASDYAIKAVFTGLVGFDSKLNVIDQLAASHKISDDGLTYTFTLKPNLKFSDGTALTSQDVVYSINRALAPATKSPVAYYLQLLKDYDKYTTNKIPTLIGDSLIASDPNTVQIVISKPAAYFLAALTYDVSYVVEKKLIDTYKDKWTDHLSEGGGAGPFKVSSYSHNKGIELVPNASYYGKQPKIQKLEYVQTGDIETSYKSYQAKQLDYATVPTAQLATVSSSKEFHSVPNFSTSYLALNYLVKPFDNIKVRQAFALAIDKDLINTTILKKSSQPSWSFIPPGSPGATNNLAGPAGATKQSADKAKAQDLLKQGLQEDGFANAAAVPQLTLTFYAPSITTKNWIAAIVQMWQTTLGINVKTETVDFPKLLTLENATSNNPKGLQIWRAGWQADYPDPQDWLSIFFEKGSDYNQFNYGQNNSTAASQQQAVQQQLLKADVEKDQVARFKAYADAEQKILNDVGVIPLWQPLNQVVVRSNVQNYPLNGLNIVVPDDWNNIYVSQ